MKKQTLTAVAMQTVADLFGREAFEKYQAKALAPSTTAGSLDNVVYQLMLQCERHPEDIDRLAPIVEARLAADVESEKIVAETKEYIAETKAFLAEEKGRAWALKQELQRALDSGQLFEHPTREGVTLFLNETEHKAHLKAKENKKRLFAIHKDLIRSGDFETAHKVYQGMQGYAILLQLPFEPKGANITRCKTSAELLPQLLALWGTQWSCDTLAAGTAWRINISCRVFFARPLPE